MRFRGRRRIYVTGIILVAIAMLPSYVRVFVIAGDSDAPNFATGDRVLLSLAAYDIRVPYTSHRLVRRADPEPGDMVLIRLADARFAAKRVVAGPGTRIAMRDNHLTIDGVALEYITVARQEMAAISRGGLYPVVEIERGNGPDVYISFGHDGSLRDFEEQVVPAGHYFVLGSNRDASMDSRQLGALQRERILGKIIGRIGSAG